VLVVVAAAVICFFPPPISDSRHRSFPLSFLDSPLPSATS
jgi:hypothetical protein